MRKIPAKNYIIYIFIILITIAVSIYVVVLFNNSKAYYEKNSVLTDIFSEVLIQEDLDIGENLNNYLLENSDLVLYISSGKNKEIKQFESEFKNYVVEKKLQENFIYINLDNIKSKNFVSEILNSYGNTEEIKNYAFISDGPMIFVFKKGYITSIYNKKEPNSHEVEWFLMGNGLVEND